MNSKDEPLEKVPKNHELPEDLRETKGIEAVMIIETLGRPPEHLIETMEEIVKNIDEEKGVVVKNKKIHEPTLIKDKKDLYAAFIEIEVEVEEILHLALLLFKYMPSHLNILTPELIALSNNGWEDILNELTRRLHQYDELAKVLQTEKLIMEKKLRDVLENHNININLGDSKSENTKDKKEG